MSRGCGAQSWAELEGEANVPTPSPRYYKCGDDGTVGSIALLDNSADDGTVGNIALPMILIALGKLTRCAPVCLNVALGDAHAPRRAGSREARRLFCNRKTSWASKTNLLDVGNPA